MRLVLLSLGFAVQLREASTVSDARLSVVDDLGQWLSANEKTRATGPAAPAGMLGQMSPTEGAFGLYLRCASILVVVPALYYVFRPFPGAKGSPQGEGEAFSMYFRRAFNGLLWLASTLSMNLSNKEAVQNTPTILALLQMAFTVLVLLLMWPVLGMDSFGKVKELTPWLPVCFLFAMMLVTALIGFALAPISVIIIMASVRPLIALLIETNLFGDNGTTIKATAAVMGAVGACVYLYGNKPASLSETAILILGFNGLIATIDRCYQRYFLHHKPIQATKAALVMTFNVGGAMLVLAAYPLWKHEIPSFLERWDAWQAGRDLGDLYVVLLSCLSGLALGYFGVAFQTDISATGFMVSQAGARTLLLIIDHFWKGTILTSYGAVGIVLVITSSVVSMLE